MVSTMPPKYERDARGSCPAFLIVVLSPFVISAAGGERDVLQFEMSSKTPLLPGFTTPRRAAHPGQRSRTYHRGRCVWSARS